MFDKVVQDLSREGGNCGSMDTHYRWKKLVSASIKKAIFRPWAMSNNINTNKNFIESANSSGVYHRIVKDLKKWSLTGFTEFTAFNAYQKQLKKSITDLALFYQKIFGWNEDDSLYMAEIALTAAVSNGFGFYMYDPGFVSEEEKLRESILSGKSIELSTIDLSIIDRNKDDFEETASRESILSIAIKRPKILKKLLDGNVDPNSYNGFGKTPLMYAAQYNQLESAKLLIKYGANTLAATNKGNNSCFYTLKTTNMTALHYAVRYASKDFIRLLLDNAAEPLMEAINKHHYPSVKETALDWFYRYTKDDFIEKNPNIDKNELKLIEGWLKIPEKKSVHIKQLIVDAEVFYKEGKTLQAYRNLRKVLAISPDNERALSDISVVSLKLNQLGVSLAASEKLIKHSKRNKIKANALFNKGLACEKYIKLGGQGRFINNGSSYCKNSFFYSYLQAWLMDGTKVRQNKLISTLQLSKEKTCRIKSPDDFTYQLYFDKIDGEDKIYFFHSKRLMMPAEYLFFEVEFFNVQNKQYRLPMPIDNSPEYIASYDLGEYVIDEMNNPFLSYYSLNLRDLSCRLYYDN